MSAPEKKTSKQTLDDKVSQILGNQSEKVAPPSNDPLLDPHSDLPLPPSVSWTDIMDSPSPTSNLPRTLRKPLAIKPSTKLKAPPIPSADISDTKLVQLKNDELMDQGIQTEGYEESYASVADLETLDNRVNTIESGIADINDKLESLLSEREAIPKQLRRIYGDLNALTTAMSEHVIALSNQRIPLPEEARSQALELKSSTGELKTLTTELQSPPSLTSQLHTKDKLQPVKKKAVK